MKKLFITVGIVAFLGMSAPAVANQKQQPENKSPLQNQVSNLIFTQKMNLFENLIREQISYLKKQSTLYQQQESHVQKIHDLINSSPEKHHIKHTELGDRLKELLPETLSLEGSTQSKTATLSDFFLEKIEPFYMEVDDPKYSEKSKIEAILKNNGLLNQHTDTYKNDRNKISARFQYGAAIDRYISHMAIATARNRFQAVRYLLSEIQKTKDLKGIAELQARIGLMLSMIQNDATKLHIFTHFRDSEHALINQRKRKLYTAVFNHENKDMPTLTSISSITSTQ